MTFYLSNLELDAEILKNMTMDQMKGKSDLTLSWSPTESRSSTDALINPPKAMLCKQLIASLMACWMCLASGASVAYFTVSLTSLQQNNSNLPISDMEGSWVASLVMLGGMVGGLLAGPCISIGRRKALWLLSGPLTLAWILIVVAQNVTLLYASHILFGVCLGVMSDAAQLYVSECASADWRGALGCVPVLMFNIGMLLDYFAGAWLDWEKMAIFGAVLTLPAALLPLVFPESPSFLVAKGRTEEAKAALSWLRGANWDISAEYEELNNCEKCPRLMERIRGLCKNDILKPLFLTTTIRALSRFCGLRAILSYIQIILNESKSSVDSKLATIITGAVQLSATLIACLLLDKLGRRKLLIASEMVMAAALIGLGLYLYLIKDLNDQELLGWIPIVAILVYIIANSMGLGPVSGIIIGELIPQRHRSIASSITGSISWLSAFIVTKSFLDLQNSLNLYGTFWLYGCLCLIGAPFTYFCLPETRGISQYGIEMLFKSDSGVVKSDCEKVPSPETGSVKFIEV